MRGQQHHRLGQIRGQAAPIRGHAGLQGDPCQTARGNRGQQAAGGAQARALAVAFQPVKRCVQNRLRAARIADRNLAHRLHRGERQNHLRAIAPVADFQLKITGNQCLAGPSFYRGQGGAQEAKQHLVLQAVLAKAGAQAQMRLEGGQRQGGLGHGGHFAQHHHLTPAGLPLAGPDLLSVSKVRPARTGPCRSDGGGAARRQGNMGCVPAGGPGCRSAISAER